MDTTPTEFAGGLASAPGDIPLPKVLEREAAKAYQFRHDNTIEPRAPHPGRPVSVTATAGVSVALAGATVLYTTDGSVPDGGSPQVEMERVAVEWDPNSGYLDRWAATIPPQADGTIVRYRIVGQTGAALEVMARDGSGFWFQEEVAAISTFAYRVGDVRLPDWFRDSVVYHVFVDRFRGDEATWPAPPADPHARHGGTLQGVREALPYLEELGVDCLWLSPLGPSPSYHRYDQTDYFDVDADLGGIAAARRLVADAHERGIRLILDFVPAHGSWLMPQFRAAQSDAGSEYRSWFIFDEWPHRYRSFLGVSPFLVTFNTADPGLRRFVTDSALFWVGDVGFDGLRLDHAIGAGSDFWVGFGDELQRARPDVTMLGEATDTPPMLRRYRGTLQGILDFPLANQLRMAFGTGELDAAAFGSALAAYMSFMGEGPDRVTFLDNHDMDRFLFVAGGDTRRLELAALCLFTLPHTPVIYYGTEVGLSQEVAKSDSGYGGDHHARSDMPWDSDAWDEGLRHTFRSLIAFRKANPALRRGSWSLLTDTPPGVVGYRLTLDEATCDVFLNLSDEPRSVGAGGRLLAGVGGSAAGDGAVVLAPLGGVVVGGP